jgi:hypothetical protein
MWSNDAFVKIGTTAGNAAWEYNITAARGFSLCFRRFPGGW